MTFWIYQQISPDPSLPKRGNGFISPLFPRRLAWGEEKGDEGGFFESGFFMLL
jgi:hypothetical protein